MKTCVCIVAVELRNQRWMKTQTKARWKEKKLSPQRSLRLTENTEMATHEEVVGHEHVNLFLQYCLDVNKYNYKSVKMNLKAFPRIILLMFFLLAKNCYGLTGIIRDLLANNVAGPAVNFQTMSWPIDPDAGLRRRTEYEALNGRYGYKHVERLGLGEDGRTEERRLQQRLRDAEGALAYTPSLQKGY